MVNAENLRLYLGVKGRDERSKMEDTLVLDGFNVRTFGTAEELWAAFQQTPARIVITERRFADGFTGLDLVINIRKYHLRPYVYAVVLSTMNNLKQIKEALAVGAETTIWCAHTILSNCAPARSWVCAGLTTLIPFTK